MTCLLLLEWPMKGNRKISNGRIKQACKHFSCDKLNLIHSNQYPPQGRHFTKIDQSLKLTWSRKGQERAWARNSDTEWKIKEGLRVKRSLFQTSYIQCSKFFTRNLCTNKGFKFEIWLFESVWRRMDNLIWEKTQNGIRWPLASQNLIKRCQEKIRYIEKRR